MVGFFGPQKGANYKEEKLIYVDFGRSVNSHVLAMGLLFAFALVLLVTLLLFHLLGSDQKTDNLCRIIRLIPWSYKSLRSSHKAIKRGRQN